MIVYVGFHVLQAFLFPPKPSELVDIPTADKAM